MSIIHITSSIARPDLKKQKFDSSFSFNTLNITPDASGVDLTAFLSPMVMLMVSMLNK